MMDRRKLFAASVALTVLAALPAVAQEPAKAKKWICPECGCGEDGKDFDKPGTCPAPGCAMTLIEKPEPPPAAPQQPASPTPPPASPPQPGAAAAPQPAQAPRSQ